jgi:hypothetical protein
MVRKLRRIGQAVDITHKELYDKNANISIPVLLENEKNMRS